MHFAPVKSVRQTQKAWQASSELNRSSNAAWFVGKSSVIVNWSILSPPVMSFEGQYTPRL
jgi:hypothetical protein